jgi:hypothetical protein
VSVCISLPSINVLAQRCKGSFDLDMPLEVDDEYWENPDPALAFRQPPGKPSFVTGFNLWAKLMQICALVLRTFVSFCEFSLVWVFMADGSLAVRVG